MEVAGQKAWRGHMVKRRSKPPITPTMGHSEAEWCLLSRIPIYVAEIPFLFFLPLI